MQPFSFFISYRRQDTAPIALLLKSEIEKRLQFTRVAVDVEDIQPGETFPDRLKSLIEGAHATIALIGKSWMPERGRVAADLEKDWVVKELEYSRSQPMAFPEAAPAGLKSRAIIPLFADCKPGFGEFELPSSLAFLQDLHAERIDYGSWPGAIGPLLDRIGKRLSLPMRAEGDGYPKPHPAKARTQAVSDAELTQVLRYDDYEGWYLDNFGSAEFRYLVKTFMFESFDEAADFMALVSDHCRTLDHHPEWRNIFKQVTVSLSTWDAHRRVTIYDLNLALYMNMAAKRIAAKRRTGRG